MNDDRHLLASSYLDGALTAEERATAESDPDVMSAVTGLARLRDELGAVEPPSPAVREAAVAAAMAAFATTRAPAAIASSVPAHRAGRRGTFTFRRRPVAVRYLGFAAATIAVGLLGVVVARNLDTGTDEFSNADSAAFATTAPGDLSQARLGEAVSESATADATADAGAADMAAAELAPSAAPDDAGGTADVATATAPTAADSATVGARPVIDPTQPLTTPAELGSFGTSLIELESAGELPPTPDTRCPQPRILGQVEYVIDGAPVLVLVAVDDARRLVVGIDPETCAALVEGPLF